MRLSSRFSTLLPVALIVLGLIIGCGTGSNTTSPSGSRVSASPDPSASESPTPTPTPTPRPTPTPTPTPTPRPKPPSYKGAPGYPPDKTKTWWWRNGAWTDQTPAPPDSKYRDRWRWDTAHPPAVPYDHWDVRNGSYEWRVKPGGTKPCEGTWVEK